MDVSISIRRDPRLSISIRRDPRFNMDDNWKLGVEPAIEEAKGRGLDVAVTTVFDEEGKIAGWKLHGWKRPPGVILYEVEDQSSSE